MTDKIWAIRISYIIFQSPLTLVSNTVIVRMKT